MHLSCRRVPWLIYRAEIAIGAGIGLASSVLGVAGGELLIPTLIFIFGADIRTAGSASILISLGIVLMGLWRYWRSNAIPQGRGIQRITFAMSAGVDYWCNTRRSRRRICAGHLS